VSLKRSTQPTSDTTPSALGGRSDLPVDVLYKSTLNNLQNYYAAL